MHEYFYWDLDLKDLKLFGTSKNQRLRQVYTVASVCPCAAPRHPLPSASRPSTSSNGFLPSDWDPMSSEAQWLGRRGDWFTPLWFLSWVAQHETNFSVSVADQWNFPNTRCTWGLTISDWPCALVHVQVWLLKHSWYHVLWCWFDALISKCSNPKRHRSVVECGWDGEIRLQHFEGIFQCRNVLQLSWLALSRLTHIPIIPSGARKYGTRKE